MLKAVQLSLAFLVLLLVGTTLQAGEKKDETKKPGEKAATNIVIDITKVELLADNWGAAATEGDKSFRPVLAGKTGTIVVDPWWGKTLRPKEGSSYLAQVVYKDTSATPILVEAFAGLPGKYELHRIGGLADGQWKTALVPVPWDMIMAKPDTGKTEFYVSAPASGDVPVASITIVDGDPKIDEPRWAAETRDWVARVQKDKRANPKRDADQTAEIPDTMKAQALVPYVRSTLRLIYDNSAPQKGEAGVPLKLRMAGNEIEPAQFGVFANGADLKNVTIALGDGGFVDAKKKSLDCKVELFTAEYSVVSGGKYFPQRFWPAYSVDVPKGRSQTFWVNVETNNGKSKPGKYAGKIVISSDGQKAVDMPVEIELLPIKLLTMKEAGLHIGGCTTGLIPAHELVELVRHNMNSINLWYYGFEPKIIKKSRTDFDLDFTIDDDFMANAAKAGIENFVYFLGGDPYGFPDTCQLERELYRRVIYGGTDLMQGRLELLQKSCASPDALLPELRPLYVKWAKLFMQHAQDKKWPEAFLTPYDEPAKWVQGGNNRTKQYYWKTPEGKERVQSVYERELAKFLADRKAEGIEPMLLGSGGADKWIKGHFKDSCAAIHEGWPKARIYGSIHHAEPGLVFLEDIEIFCTNAIHEDPKLGDKVRAAPPNGGRQKVFWQYSGGGDSADVSQGRYNFGVFFASFNSRGSLCWAYNWGGRFDTSTGDNWLYGWTTPYGVVRAPFWEGMREAWDDRRYIETLRSVAKAKGKEQEAENLLSGIFNNAVSLRAAGGRDTVNDFYARSNDPEALDTMRGKIIDKIISLQK
jgi:hypothetical protein